MRHVKNQTGHGFLSHSLDHKLVAWYFFFCAFKQPILLVEFWILVPRSWLESFYVSISMAKFSQKPCMRCTESCILGNGRSCFSFGYASKNDWTPPQKKKEEDLQIVNSSMTNLTVPLVPKWHIAIYRWIVCICSMYISSRSLNIYAILRVYIHLCYMVCRHWIFPSRTKKRSRIICPSFLVSASL